MKGVLLGRFPVLPTFAVAAVVAAVGCAEPSVDGAALSRPLAGTPSAAGTSVADLERRVDALFAPFEQGASPGAAVLVVQDGAIELARGYGLADVESGRAIQRDTPIRLGSLSKQFTAMAVMILADRGRLDYDDPAARWLPEISRYEGITIRHLLTHTSGLPDYYDRLEEVGDALASADGDPLLTEVDAISLYADWGEPLFAPGAKYEYSNPGYEALAVIVKRVSGRALGDFLIENVFQPVGMTSSALRDRPDVEITNRAKGYRTAGSTYDRDDDHVLNWMVGAGGVYTTLDDLYLWDQALYSDRLVSPRTMAQAFTPMILNSGEVSHYGFGWRLQDRLGRRAVQHTGSWVGFRSAMIRFVDDRLTVVVLSNSREVDSDGLAEGVARLYLGLPTQA